jgi:signal transduction histidine kinase
VHRISYWIRFAILFGLYLSSGMFGLKLASVSGFASAVWAPSGIALATLFLFGRTLWPSIFLAAFFVNFLMGQDFFPSMGTATGNTLEALLAHYFLTRVHHDMGYLGTLRNTSVLIFLCAGLSTMISATIGVIMLGSTGHMNISDLEITWFTWWLGDVVSILVITPLILSCFPPYLALAPSGWLRKLEAIALMIAGLTISWWIFCRTPAEVDQSPVRSFSYFVFPFLAWSSVRFGYLGATLAVFAVTVIAMWGTSHYHGIFVLDSFPMSLLNLESFVIVIATSTLLLASIIIERQISQNQLQENQTKLARSNAELQQFAYIASHDLQEPLRTVHNWAELLRQDYLHQLPEGAKEYLEFISSGIFRMSQLVRNLLEFSLVGHGGLKVSTFNAVECIRGALTNLQKMIEDSGATIVSQEIWPTITADKIRLTQVFQNLISNAIKFRRSEPVRIQIEAQDTKSEWVFHVRDNGTGFSMEASEKIFKIFQRLHSAAEVSGAGIGLAVCKKIIEQHGGEIWVDSKVNDGSTFSFSIPKRSGPRLSA